MRDEPTGWQVLAGLAITAAFIAVVGGLQAVWAQYVYHDWTCAFSECRRER